MNFKYFTTDINTLMSEIDYMCVYTIKLQISFSY